MTQVLRFPPCSVIASSYPTIPFAFEMGPRAGLKSKKYLRHDPFLTFLSDSIATNRSNPGCSLSCMSVGAERARLEEARSQVRALRSEVCHFEALVDEPPSAASAATVADKVTKVCATNLVASKAVHTQPKSARATSLTSNGPASHQQLVHSTRPGAPAPPPRQRSIGTRRRCHCCVARTAACRRGLAGRRCSCSCPGSRRFVPGKGP